jgi:putative transposase
MDIIVVDEVERKPLGRPWLTVVIDVATRMIAGYYLSFDHPSSSSVALALSRAVLPKDRHLERFNVTANWPSAACLLPSIWTMRKSFMRALLREGVKNMGSDWSFVRR